MKIFQISCFSFAFKLDEKENTVKQYGFENGGYKKNLLEGGWCLTINRGIGNISKKRGVTRE